MENSLIFGQDKVKSALNETCIHSLPIESAEDEEEEGEKKKVGGKKIQIQIQMC